MRMRTLGRWVARMALVAAVGVLGVGSVSLSGVQPQDVPGDSSWQMQSNAVRHLANDSSWQ